MTEDDTVVISSDGQLTLTSVSTDHEGEWKCQATNSSGSNDANTQLTVIPIKGNTCAQACMHTHIHAQTNAYNVLHKNLLSRQINAFTKTQT